MKLSSYLKVGTFTVIVILVSWWGIKWLGGQNILLSNNIYTVYYDDVTGLMDHRKILGVGLHRNGKYGSFAGFAQKYHGCGF